MSLKSITPGCILSGKSRQNKCRFLSFYHLFTKHLFCFPLWKTQFSTLSIVDNSRITFILSTAIVSIFDTICINSPNYLFHLRYSHFFSDRPFHYAFCYFGTEQETSYPFFRSIGESESEDPTLTETLARRLS